MTDNVNVDDVPSRLDLLNLILTTLHELGGSAFRSELKNKVIENMGLPPAVRPSDPENKAKLEDKVGFAMTRLKRLGLVDNAERGVWSLTAKGRETQHVDPEEAVRSARQQDRVRKQAKSTEAAPTEKVKNSAEDPADETASWREDLLDTLQNIPPDAFERLCQRLLRESGFTEVVVTGKSGDGGIDGHGIIRLAGLISFPVLFQCKRYSGSVGASVVRDFRGAMMGRAEKGVILTTGGFTREAQREATRDGVPLIDLIDGELLIDKIKELELGVSVRKKMVEVVEVDKDWFASI
ncbi:MAG: restriction endonuclease [Gemmatimonadetes bacterium]|nr:restriction endonuclease [Gemmatimonadota bacterium]